MDLVLQGHAMRIFSFGFRFVSVFLFLQLFSGVASAFQDPPIDLRDLHFQNAFSKLAYTLGPEEKKELGNALQSKKINWKIAHDLADSAESRMGEVRKECAGDPLKFAHWTKQLSQFNFEIGRWKKGVKLARVALSLPVVASNESRQKETAEEILHAWSNGADFPGGVWRICKRSKLNISWSTLILLGIKLN